MSKLIRNRWLRWSLLVAALIALGVGIYHVEAPAPLCTIEGEWWPLGFADEGRRLVVIPDRPPDPVDGPVRIFDTRTGAEIARHLAKNQAPEHSAISQDGRFVAVETLRWKAETKDRTNNSLFLIDTQMNQMREIPLGEDVFASPWLTFSDQGDVLLRTHSDSPRGLRIWDTATGQLLRGRPIDKADYVRVMKGIVINEFPNGTRPPDLEFWSTKERKTIVTLPRAGRFVDLSRDQSFCATVLPGVNGEPSSRMSIWNMNIRERVCEFPLRKHSILADNFRWFATVGRDDDGPLVELRAIPGGDVVKTTREKELGRIEFSPDGNYMLTAPTDVAATFEIRDVPGLNVLWRLEQLKPVHATFSLDSRLVFVRSPETASLQIIDIATGSKRAEFPLPRVKFKWDGRGLGGRIVPTPAGYLLAAHEMSDIMPTPSRWLEWMQWITRRPLRSMDSLVVVDVDSCREHFRLDGWGTISMWFANDGRTLATVHDIEPSGHVICCWDMDAFKPLHLPVGVPAFFGSVMVTIACWRGRRRKPPVAPHASQ